MSNPGSVNNQTSVFRLLIILMALVFATSPYAADFTIVDGSVAGPQTLEGNETGVIEKGGAISATFAHGITVSNSNNIIVNKGSITADSIGIFLESGSDSIINNYGVIMGSDGIFANGPITLNNHGRIFTTRVGAIATTSDLDNTVNLFSRSQIIGRIVFGAGGSSTYTFDLADIINLKSDNMVNVGGLFGVSAVVDHTGQSVNGAVLGSMTGSLHNIIARRLAHSPTSAPPQLASTHIGPNMLSLSPGNKIWVSGFGSHRERGEDSRVLAYDHNYYGTVAGYETGKNRSRIGFLAGYAHSDVETGFTSINTNSDSYFAGVYGQENFGWAKFDVSLLAGYESHDNERLVVDNMFGFETAEADFDSFFISPSITLGTEHKLHEKISVRPSATGTYSAAWYNSYTESGTTQSNLSIDDRLAHALIAKVQIEIAYLFSQGGELGFHIGGRYRYTTNDDVNATLSGVSFQYATAGDDTYLDAIVGPICCLLLLTAFI
jgi:uncharacterized protein YhjY with autotransporter beta-barrel domain